MSDKGPNWNTYGIELPSHIWLDPLGIDESDFKNGNPLNGVIVSRDKNVSFNCKFVPYQKFLDSQNEIKRLIRQVERFRNEQ